MSETSKTLQTIKDHYQALALDSKADFDKQSQAILELSEGKNDWAYEIWPELVDHLKHKEAKIRTLAGQHLCYLAMQSDPEKRVLEILPDLIGVTYDMKLADVRPLYNQLWRIAKAGKAQESSLIELLKKRYMDAISEKQTVAIREEVLKVMKTVFQLRSNLAIKELALVLVGLEFDPVNKQKYLAIWS